MEVDEELSESFRTFKARKTKDVMIPIERIIVKGIREWFSFGKKILFAADFIITKASAGDSAANDRGDYRFGNGRVSETPTALAENFCWDGLYKSHLIYHMPIQPLALMPG